MGSDSEQGRMSGLQRATGRDRSQWFALLDGWGAGDRGYREIAVWLTEHHGLTDWWAQKLIVEYQQERGLRPPGIRPDGTFTVTASKTVVVPVDRVYEVLVDPAFRHGWLGDVPIRERDARPGHSVRFDWEPGRVDLTFTSAGEGRCQVAVEHRRLPDLAAAEDTKAYWKERLTELKTLLEASE